MSDHIPDVTKMIGETPRTDAKRSGPNHFMGDWVNGNFAAQLERELNAVSKERDEAVFVTEKVLKEFSEHSISLCKAIDELNADNSKIELLMSANADVARIADERDAAENRIRLLIAERDTARRQADQQYKLREEFTELLKTDDVEQGVAVVREMRERIKRLEEELERTKEDRNAIAKNTREPLLLKLDHANERISKLNDYVAALETAGDLMANELSYGYDVDMWHKAKGEAKP